MTIFVAGPSGGKPYDKAVALKIESAVAIMSAKLGIAHMPMDFDIMMGRTVNKTDGDCQGWCFAKQYKKAKAWEVSIFIWRKKRFRDMIKTLAHEMVHVKQFVKDGLDLSSEPTFKGKKFVAKKSQDAYWDAPWEKEAYAKQDKLAQYYFDYVKKNA